MIDKNSSDKGLADKAVRGVGWSAISQFSCHGIQFIVLIVLAHLLVPKDFGIISMVSIFTGLMKVTNQLGLSAAIIQRKEINELHLSTSFWTTLSMGLVLFGACVVSAPIVAQFFNNPLVRPVMMLSSVVFIILPFGMIHSALLTRNLDFRKIAIVEIGGILVYGIVSILLALLGFGVWGLVWGGIASSFTQVALWWLVCSWRPSRAFSLKRLRELFGFGANITGFALVNYAQQNVDYLLVGKFLGATALGYYFMAYRLISFPQKRLSPVITRVAFPVLSRIQEKNEMMRKAYKKIITGISLISFPLLLGLFCVGPEFVRVVYGSQWNPTILPMQILCIAGLLYSIGTTVGSIILSKGRADLQLRIGIVSCLALTGFILYGTRHGLVGIAIAISTYALLTLFVVQTIANNLIGLKMKDYLSSLNPAILGCIPMVAILVIFRQTISTTLNLNDIGTLTVSILLGALIYGFTLRMSKFKALDEFMSLLKKLAR